jgi:hypothetical protein
MISTIADIITALATLGMMAVAWLALHTWRKEFIGQKKIELAAEIMEAVLEFQDVLINARIDIFPPQEIDEIKKWLEEVNYKKQNIPNSIAWPIYIDRIYCLTPFHRLNKNADTIDKFATMFNKSLIYWDENLFRLLQELHSFLGKIRYASEMLYENPGNTELQQIAFTHTTNDLVSKRIFEIGDEIKLNLEPLYKDQRMSWKKLAVQK